jgi:hypothetical protein
MLLIAVKYSINASPSLPKHRCSDFNPGARLLFHTGVRLLTHVPLLHGPTDDVLVSSSAPFSKLSGVLYPGVKKSVLIRF